MTGERSPAMKFDADAAKIVRISVSIENYAEQMEDRCDEAMAWKEDEKASIGWCVGIHIASVLNKILAPHERADALSAINDSLRPDSLGTIVECP
jgi:hypothetical protein